MSWSIGYDKKWKRDIGYGVPAKCDHPDCTKQIDRGLSHVCGGQPYGGEYGCGLYFCETHLECGTLCERCAEQKPSFEPSADTHEWELHKLTHESWGTWRKENSEQVEQMKLRTAP